MPPQPRYSRAKFTELWNSGIDAGEIAKEFGITRETVYTTASRFELERRREHIGDNETITVRVSKQMKKKLEGNARAKGLTFSAYVRRILKKELSNGTTVVSGS